MSAALTESLRAAAADQDRMEWEHRPATACCKGLPGTLCWDVRLCAGLQGLADDGGVEGCCWLRSACRPRAEAGPWLADAVKAASADVGAEEVRWMA
jgi:hypothetical protein